MSDQLLLELAAKAAGIGPVLCYEARRRCLRIGNRSQYYLWRPLTTDGDAFRLSISSRMDVEQNRNSETEESWVCASGFGHSAMEEFRSEGSRADATRRAIVRTAAKIGRSMP
ncbi:hypothetical protein CUN61_15810 [Pseudomonas arsenicoxydans]|uniref:Uncharacterized protein n=1 Tax=Pseudomonas arsenicoxydans TaxID=702115 RepID=A0A4P6G344_9PSED|nr:hypothetical protein CUN61_15810 [Pseudomonas arsenicoxydans]